MILKSTTLTNKFYSFILIYFLSFAFLSNVKAQETDPTSIDSTEGQKQDSASQDTANFMSKLDNFNSFMEKAIVYIPFPVVSVSQETGLLLGLTKFNDFKMGVTTKSDTITQPSTVSGLIYYTENKQFKVNFESDLMFKDNKHNLKSRLTYFNFPLGFWGVGNETKPDTGSIVVYENFEFAGSYRHKIRSKMYLGFSYKYLNSLQVYYQDSTDVIPGYDVSENAGLRSGIGLTFTYEGRDNRLNAYKGSYVNIEYQGFVEWLGSDFSYNTFLVDLRKYYRLFGTERVILAGQFVGQFVEVGAPIQSLAALGGPKGMRGYYFAKYRDQTSLSGHVELRFPLWWILGGTAFVSAGQVSPDFSKYSWDRNHYGYGFGLRLMISSANRVNLRLDFGFSEENFTFVLGFSELF